MWFFNMKLSLKQKFETIRRMLRCAAEIEQGRPQGYSALRGRLLLRPQVGKPQKSYFFCGPTTKRGGG